MFRSERLLSLLQALRHHRRSVSGKVLASEMGVSIRTLYRDIGSPGLVRLHSVPASACRRAAAAQHKLREGLKWRNLLQVGNINFR
jgi:HTH domain